MLDSVSNFTLPETKNVVTEKKSSIFFKHGMVSKKERGQLVVLPMFATCIAAMTSSQIVMLLIEN